MKITGFEIVVVGTPWRELTIVEVQTDVGITGLGEVRMVNKTDTLIAAIEELGNRYLIGADPADLSKLAWNIKVAEYGLPGEVGQSALAVFDIACWDILGKSLGVPVYQLLGGVFTARVEAYANGWYQGDRDPKVIAEYAGKVVERGYRGLKIDPFGHASAEISRNALRESVGILEAVRGAVGPDINIYVEMHGRFTSSSARAVAKAIEHIEPAWIEEPVSPMDIGGLRNVRNHTHLPIALGERIHQETDLIPFLEEGLVDILQVDTTHCGGITGLQRLVGWSDAYNVRLAPHNVAGPIGTAAALHVAIAASNTKVLEHFNDFADPWIHEIVEGAPYVNPKDGCFELPTAPGLGVTLNRAACAEHPRTGGRLALYAPGWEKRQDVKNYGG
ncbi:MAG TPA: mandelate racemase/muconate lactonizing enzyme family protein [Candidatus Paceibacterota bacterium]|nr:mandelate racemase/muconate lactonizing enzyme family protein [Candidatus Paceibacterota bacterium]